MSVEGEMGEEGTKKGCEFHLPTIHHRICIDEVENHIAVMANSTAMKFPLDGERENSDIVTVASLLNLSKGYEASLFAGDVGGGKGMYKFQTTSLKAEGLHDHQTTSK